MGATEKDGTPITGFFAPQDGGIYPNPTAKQTSTRTAQTFQAQINPWSSALATCDEPLNAWTLPVSSASGCPTVKVADREYLQPIYINACADSYGLQIDGGLTQTDQNNLWQQENKPGHKLVMGIVRQIRDHLPWISKLYAGRGIKLTDYGLFPIPDPDNPGHSIAAPGTKDKRVQGKLIDALSSGDAGGRQRLVPGQAIDFTLCPAPLDPPTITTSVGTGPSGDNEQRQYALVYKVGSAHGELGPGSDWVPGYLQTDLVIPIVPSGAGWAAVTGQALYRTKGDDTGIFYLHTTYADLLTHSFTDTTPDASLGAAYVKTPTAINFERAYTDVLHSPDVSNSSGIGLGGVDGNGATLGNHDRVDYLPDPTTIQMLPCAAPRVAPSVSVSVGAGPGAGDRQYAILYHTATGDSVKGPASAWIEGTLATGVALAAVPTLPTGVWSDVTGQALLRTKAGGGPFYVVHDYPGSLTLQGFIDTVPDSSLVTGYSEQAVTVKSLGGGGGGSAPPSNGAIYNIGSDFDAIASGGTTYYIPWDTILMGADLYLDVGHTDGLTIPADGAGDYTVNTLLRFNTQGFAATGWSVQWFLTIEVWRSGSQILFLSQDDIYQHPLDHDGFPILDEDSELPFQMSAVLPGLHVGDVVKIGWQYYNGGSLASGPHTPGPGAQVIESGPYTYISIGRIGVTP